MIKPPKKQTHPLTLIFAICLAAGTIIAIIAASTPLTPEQQAKRDTQATIDTLTSRTKQHLRTHLLTPSIAKIQLRHHIIKNDWQDYHIITGHVDTQNKYGTTLRKTIHYIYNTDTLKLTYAALDNKTLQGHIPLSLK